MRELVDHRRGVGPQREDLRVSRRNDEKPSERASCGLREDVFAEDPEVWLRSARSHEELRAAAWLSRASELRWRSRWSRGAGVIASDPKRANDKCVTERSLSRQL